MTAKKKIILDDAPKMELNNYDMHKQLYAQMKSLSDEDLNKKLVSIGGWFSTFAKDKYFTLMCREIYDFTVFRFNHPNYAEGVSQLKKLLENRGEIIDINYIHRENAYECWIKNRETEEVRMYYLFSSEWMVIEIG